MCSWPLLSLSWQTSGRHDATLRGRVSVHCCNIGRRPLRTELAHCRHLFGTKCGHFFAQKMAPSFAHSCWTHCNDKSVPTYSATFFELYSSSSKNVAAERETGRFRGQRRMGTTRTPFASSIGLNLKPSCGHGPAWRPLARLASVHDMGTSRIAFAPHVESLH